MRETTIAPFSLTDAQLTEAAETAALFDEGFIEDHGNGYAVRIPGCEPFYFADLTSARRAVRWAIGQAEGATVETVREEPDDDGVAFTWTRRGARMRAMVREFNDSLLSGTPDDDDESIVVEGQASS